MTKARCLGVCTPLLYTVDPVQHTLTFEYVEGLSIKDIFLDFESNGVVEERMVDIAVQIGDAIGKLHDGGLTHGDLTTSNMLIRNNANQLMDQILASFRKSSKQCSSTLNKLAQESQVQCDKDVGSAPWSDGFLQQFFLHKAFFRHNCFRYYIIVNPDRYVSWKDLGNYYMLLKDQGDGKGGKSWLGCHRIPCEGTCYRNNYSDPLASIMYSMTGGSPVVRALFCPPHHATFPNPLPLNINAGLDYWANPAQDCHYPRLKEYRQGGQNLRKHSRSKRTSLSLSHGRYPQHSRKAPGLRLPLSHSNRLRPNLLPPQRQTPPHTRRDRRRLHLPKAKTQQVPEILRGAASPVSSGSTTSSPLTSPALAPRCSTNCRYGRPLRLPDPTCRRRQSPRADHRL
ncbi:KEOPS complex subunit Bud32 like [Actinidia chinensis var. chinensis]|uniref:non-specific serine/threonine protein kinase n=1 Tax=Actinidia chinensis var. chinensis TaxID=1590841 RepID=A0A2R6P621_ACTCC|nr:KEOPS complex subunit Bud32 like [Actinidia chinensis var. chinensis]